MSELRKRMVEERDFFEWEAAITEMRKLRRLLGFKR